MKKVITLLACFVIYMQLYSQVTFEKGYFIDISGLKTDCLIKNMEWRYNPTHFRYRLLPDSEIQEANIDNVKEFGVVGKSKYIRANVEIDRASNNIDQLSNVRSPEFKEELLFLKVIIEGEASLYRYTENALNRYFFSLKTKTPKQLVYKKYKIERNGGNQLSKGATQNFMIRHNNGFRQQLLVNLKSETITRNRIRTTKYTTSSLKSLFKEYNASINSTNVEYEVRAKKDMIHFTLRPAFGSSNLSVNGNQSLKGFGNKKNIKLGCEVELVLPYNMKKWSIVMEPTYRYFSGDNKTRLKQISGRETFSKVYYKTIDFPIGLRHYFYLNNKSALFVNALLSFNYAFDSFIESQKESGQKKRHTFFDSTSMNAVVGLGYKYNKRFHVELRQSLNRTVFKGLYQNVTYNSLDLVLGVAIF